MARRQRTLDGEGPVVAFAARLRQARQDAGLTLRQLSAVSGYSHSTLSIAETGRKLPTWEVAAAFAQACGQQDIQRWRIWWEAGESFEAASGLGDTPMGDQADQPDVRAAEPGPADSSDLEPGTIRQGRRLWGPVLLSATASAAITSAVFLAIWPSPVPATQAVPFPSGTAPTPIAVCGGTHAGYDCHKKDPDATGCWEDAQIVNLAPFSYEGQTVGKLENWYSKKCGTNWVQLRIPKGWQGRVEIAAANTKDCFPVDCQSFYTETPPLWTNMLFAMNQATSAKGYVKFPTGEIKGFDVSTAGT